MLSIVYIVASIGILLRIVRLLFEWVEILRTNQYSIRRLREQVTIRKFLSPLNVFSWLLILSYPYVIFHDTVLTSYHLAIMVFALFSLIYLVFESIHQKQYLFPRDKKSFVIVFLALLCIGILYLFPPVDAYLWLLILERSAFFVVILCSFLFALPEEFFLDYREERIKQKTILTKDVSALYAIGVDRLVMTTVLAKGLQEKWQVLLPERIERSALLSVLEQASNTPNSLVLVPFETFTPSDLTASFTLFPPQILVIGQPLHELKPSTIFEAILSNKSKPFMLLIPAILRNSRSVRNGKKRIFSYGEQHVSPTADIVLSDISCQKYTTTFTLTILRKKTTFTIPFVTKQSALYLAPLLSILLMEGVSPEMIKRLLKDDTVTGAVFTPIRKEGITMIKHFSDTKPDDLNAYTEYCKLFSSTKILVADGNILKRYLTEKKRVDEIARVFDYIFIIASTSARECMTAFSNSKETVFSKVISHRETKLLQRLMQKNDVVIFFGPDTESLLTVFLDKKERDSTHSS